jgi:hypothetical protein
MPVTFVGDVHGWADRLERVLAQAEGDLVFVGDLIDRGPEAPAVLDRVHALCASGRARCLMGNHEYALVRGLGVPALGIAGDQRYYDAWVERYGGDQVVAAYGIGDEDRDGLARALGDHLPWMAQLPWLLQGEEAGRGWYAVHAGFDDGPLAPQIVDLARAHEHLRNGRIEQPPALYAKPRAFLVPCDLPEGWCVVSGHTPQPRARVGSRRILCDTSGGMPGRALSAVVWPEGRVITS